MSETENLDDLLQHGAVKAGQGLLGWRLYVKDGNQLIGGMITETEAYTEDDEASHSFKCKTERNQVMFDSCGRLYVYFTYGMHFCVNIVTGAKGRGEAVLLRAIEPDKGLDTIRARRNFRSDKELANGPAKITQALAITDKDNGIKLNQDKFILLPPEKAVKFCKLPRVGIKQAIEKLWRFKVCD